MRGVFLSIVVAALSLSFDAYASTNGDIYKYCRKYADRSFQFEESSDVICFSYFAGIRDFGRSICKGWKKVSDQTQSTEAKEQIKIFLSMEGVGDLKNLDAALQHYVNKMKNEPERWDFRADYAVLESLQAIAPCK